MPAWMLHKKGLWRFFCVFHWMYQLQSITWEELKLAMLQLLSKERLFTSYGRII